MNWLLIAALGLAAWLSVVLFFLALCRAAAQADARGQPALVGERRNVVALPVRRRPAA